MSVRCLKHKVKSLVEDEHEFSFHDFIFRLRQCLGASRRLVSDDTGITQSRLANLENGNFLEIDLAEVLIICEYYSVPKALLIKKSKEFVAEKVAEKGKFRRLQIQERKAAENRERPAI